MARGSITIGIKPYEARARRPGAREGGRQVTPKWMLFTLFGEAFLAGGQALSGEAIRQVLMAVGATSGAVRAALHRMVEAGWLRQEQVGATRRYFATPRLLAVVEEGGQRILAREQPTLPSGQWCMVVFAVPERRRDRRDRFRKELEWRGFGCLASGVWISTRDQADHVRALGRRLGVADHVHVIHAHLDHAEERRAVRTCWQLDALGARYAEFVARWAPRYRAYLADPFPSDRACFTEHFLLFNEYRWFPFADPGLRAELLPADWPGKQAIALFEEYQGLLTPRAYAYLAGLLKEGDAAPTGSRQSREAARKAGRTTPDAGAAPRGAGA